MSLQTLSEAEIRQIQAELIELNVEHRDLDQVISRLTEDPPPDDLLTRRLKKRKLLLKDRVLQLEQLLVPDVPA